MQTQFHFRQNRSIIFWGLALITLLWALFGTGVGVYLYGTFFIGGGFSNLEAIMSPQGYAHTAQLMKQGMLPFLWSFVLLVAMVSLIFHKYKAAKITLILATLSHVVFLVWGHYASNSIYQGELLSFHRPELTARLIEIIALGGLFFYIHKYQKGVFKA